MPSEVYFFTTEAQAITVATGSISSLSSILVIYIIIRSQTSRNGDVTRHSWSSYHIIMLFMSFWDVVLSFGMALSTLPMPSDVHEVYAFAGKAYGNRTTCAMQAFAIITGQCFTISSIVALSLLYVCTIRYGMSEKVARNKLLPGILFVTLTIALPTVLIPLSLGLLNPRPYEPYCYTGVYPIRCNSISTIDCRSPNVSVSTENKLLAVLISYVSANFLILVISLIFVVTSVFQNDRIGKMIMKQKQRLLGIRRFTKHTSNNAVNVTRSDSSSPSTNPSNEDVSASLRAKILAKEEECKNTRVVLRLAIIYIAAFLLTWVWTIMTVTVPVDTKIYHRIVDTAKLIFQPLQGFFNAIIFIINKAHMVQESIEYSDDNENRGENDLTTRTNNHDIWEALKVVLTLPENVPEVLIRGVDMVEHDIAQMQEEQQRWFTDSFVEDAADQNGNIVRTEVERGELEDDQHLSYGHDYDGDKPDEWEPSPSMSLSANSYALNEFSSIETPSMVLSHATYDA